MRFNFKKISAIVTSTILVGMTLGVGAAANYPEPFVTGGVANAAVVLGTGPGVSITDTASGTTIQTNLQSKVIATGGDITLSGESAPIWSGSDRIYFQDQLADGGVTQVTKSDLPTILADGTFDNGVDNDYTQRIEFGAATYPTFTFSDSGADLTDPKLIIDLGTATATPVYDLIVDFDAATIFNSTDAEGEQITLFGKEYTVSTETDGDELYLFASSETVTLSIGGTDPVSQTVTIEGKTYTVELKGATATTADIKVTNSAGTSDTKTITEGSSSKVNGLEVGVNIASSSEATSSESAEIMIGANKIKLKSGDEVKVGSSLDGIDGTLVTLTPATNTGALTQIKIGVTADDNENDHLAVGDSFKDPVFGSVKLSFVGIKDGPTFIAEKDTSTTRSKIEVMRDGNAALNVKLTDNTDKTATIPFAYDVTAATGGDDLVLADKTGNVISVVEAEDISTDESYVILNSGGEYVAMGQIKTMSNTDCTATDFTVEDVLTGDDIVDWDDQVIDTTKTFTYKGKTFTVGCADGGVMNITDATTTKTNVYPFIELFSGYDHRVALVQDVDAMLMPGVANLTSGSQIFTLPTGDATVTYVNGSSECVVTFVTGSTTLGTITTSAALPVMDTFAIGTVFYSFNVTGGAGADTCVDAMTLTIGVDATQDTTDGWDTHAGLLIVEEKDATNSDAKEAIYIRTDDTGGTDTIYMQTLTPIFTDAEVSDSYAADGLTGIFDRFGAYALVNTDGDQDIIEVTLPKTQMYAEMYIAEESAAIGGDGATNVVLIKDSEVGSFATKNLVIIGGSCINSAAAALVGGQKCGDSWTTATKIGAGQFLIKGFRGTSLTSGLALLVAGYNVEDTVNAVTYLKTQTVDTESKYKGTTATIAAIDVTLP